MCVHPTAATTSDLALVEHLVRLDRHRLAQQLMPLLAALETASRKGDCHAATRLVARARELLRAY
jgi:hypothetical protein